MFTIILAAHENDQYVATACTIDQDIDLYEILNKDHCNIQAAETLVKIGMYANNNPVRIDSPRALVEYALSKGAVSILCFENGKWEETSILSSNLDDVLQGAA